MKLKYKFGVFNLLDSYPTSEDALFEIVNFLQERNKMQEEWSDLGIKGAFSKRLEDEDISTLLNDLSTGGFLSKRSGAGKRCYYKVLKNPFQ